MKNKKKKMIKLKQKINYITKNVKIICMSLLFLMCFSTTFQAQGVDLIVWMDNSGSVNATEYEAMATTTRNIIDATLTCNPSKNRVAVVEYGQASLSDGSRPNRLFIESDFTNNAVTAKNFSRRGTMTFPTPANEVGFNDEAHSALGLIGDALDGINNTGIVSTQKTLTRTPGNRLVVFFFTDAERNYFPGSSLVNPSSGDVFLNYNNFKANRGAHFVVLKGGPNEINTITANRAAAAIASVGGSFTDATNIDANPSDPQGSKTTPRAYYYTTNFTLSPVNLNALVGEICSTACYKPGISDAGNIYPTKHGITALGRAGTDSDNWPMVRQSAWSVLESKTKGFVINRVKFNASNQPVADDGTTLVITSPVEGMMVYDTINNCLKVYTSNDGGATFAWHCMSTQACPQ